MTRSSKWTNFPKFDNSFFGFSSQKRKTNLKLLLKKGSAFILTRQTTTNLGRYWPNTGPQVTLYTPGVFTEPNDSETIVMLLEMEGTSCDSIEVCEVELIDYPIIDSLKNVE